MLNILGKIRFGNRYRGKALFLAVFLSFFSLALVFGRGNSQDSPSPPRVTLVRSDPVGPKRMDQSRLQSWLGSGRLSLLSRRGIAATPIRISVFEWADSRRSQNVMHRDRSPSQSWPWRGILPLRRRGSPRPPGLACPARRVYPPTRDCVYRRAGKRTPIRGT